MAQHRPHPAILAQARALLAHPDRDLTDSQRMIAWSALKSERGQRINQLRLLHDQRARRMCPQLSVSRAAAGFTGGGAA